MPLITKYYPGRRSLNSTNPSRFILQENDKRFYFFRADSVLTSCKNQGGKARSLKPLENQKSKSNPIP